ncbi:MAG: outer membrane beta-barrel protein [Desulfobacula sp.]|nr:outer membrane beta-barrel protein [Desulfobacula sp.]
MKIKIFGPKFYVQTLSVLFFLLVSMPSVHSRMITQLIPTLTITEEYSDNYLKTENDKQKEYITSVGLGFSVGFLTKTRKIYLAYDPAYKKYDNLDDRDRLEHRASFDGEFNPSKRTSINTYLAYSGTNQTNEGDTWQNIASISGDSQLSKHTSFDFFQEYSNNFDQNIRTGEYKEHEVNTTLVGISNQFGEKDRMGLDFSYEFDDYKNSDADTYTQYSPSGFITYWITPLNGLDSNVSYENRTLDNFSNDIETYTGDIRYLRKFSKHFDGYLKYRHYYSIQDSGTHQIYHPSAGFDWDVTEDSGISLGLGVLFQDRENGNNSTNPFIDIDVYKTFEFSKTRSLSLTASSGYEESTGENINTGFSRYYQAGFDYNHQLQKRLSSNLYGSCKLDQYEKSATVDRSGDTITYLTGFQLDYQLLERLYLNLLGSYALAEFHETAVDRQDKTTTIGGGFSWNPLRWLQFNLSYDYIDFNTDSSERGDYTENRATFSVSLIPARPVRMEALPFSPSRQSLEDKVFNY